MSSVYDVFKELEREQQIQTFAEGEETIDSNNYCMLESDTTRKILIPEKYSIFGVESDEKVKTVKFAFPRYVDDGRLDLMNYQIRINYKTANPYEKNNKDQTHVQNVHTVGDYIVFEWLLSRRVTQYRGTITFIVCAITANEDGTITTEWNTTIATSQSIEGMEVSPNENEEYHARDLLTELLVSLNNSKNDAITEITQTKTQAISDVQAEGQTQTEAVDAKGSQVLESIPDDYTTLENRVDELEQNRAYVIVGNGSGEFVTLNDSSELKTRNVKLFGKSVQAETTGAQLFNINKLKELDDGVEIIDYSTGEMEISQQNNAMLTVRLSDICPNMVAGQTYYLTGETTSNNKYLNVGAMRWNFDEAFVPEESDLLVQCNFECTTQTGQSGEIIYYKDTFKNIMIVEGSTEKPYEVYTGGEAATEPTPDYPLPIMSVGNYNAESEKYEVGIAVTGAQLFDASKILTKSQGGATVTNNGDGSFTVSGSGNLTQSFVTSFAYTHEETLMLLKPGMLKSKLNQITLPYFEFQLRNKTSILASVINFSTTESYTNITDEMLNDENSYVNILFYASSGLIKYGTIKPMLYQSGDGTWEPFEQQLSTLQIPNPLRGIPVDSGGNYTDAEGQQWLCDYIDRERGKYVQCVNEIIFDGSENWLTYVDSSRHEFSGYQVIENSNLYESKYNMKTDGGVINSFGMCNNFPVDTAGFGSQLRPGLWIGFAEVRRWYVHNVSSDYEALEDWKNWLSKNPMKVIYPIEIPIETDLTQEQLAALNLSTYQGITNIGTDTMPQVGIDVEYIADTKTYIDNAIAEAIAAIPTE